MLSIWLAPVLGLALFGANVWIGWKKKGSWKLVWLNGLCSLQLLAYPIVFGMMSMAWDAPGGPSKDAFSLILMIWAYPLLVLATVALSWKLRSVPIALTGLIPSIVAFAALLLIML